MKKLLIFIILLLPLMGFTQVAQDYTANSDSSSWLGTKNYVNTMVSDSVKNTLADLNVQLSVKLLDSTSLNTEAELETLTGINFYKVGDDIPLADGGLGMTSGEKGSLVYFTAGNTLGRKAWTAAGALFSTGADSTIAWITDLPTAMTIGTAYIYRVGGTDVAFADGGLGFSTALQGDMLYWSNFDTPAKLGWSEAGKLVIDLADSAMGKTTLTFPTTILQGDLLYGSNFSTVGKFAWTGAGNYLVSAADSAWTTASLLKDLTVSGTGISGGADDILLGVDSDVTITLTVSKDVVAGDGLGGGEDDVLLGADADVTFTVLADAAGGIETTDDSINIKLDGTTLSVSATGLKVTDNTYQPLEATLTDIADGTIAEDLVNTTNPWADNEVADNITASSYLPLAGGNMTGDIAFSDPGTSANSKSLIFISDNATEPDSASIQSMFGDDPYLRFCAPSDAGNLTAIMDLKDQRVVIGAGTAGVDYDLFFNGETNDGIITYDEDNNVFGFNNGVQANHLLVSDATALPAGIATYCPIAVKDDSFMICLDGVTWLHIVTQARATP